MQHWSWGEGVGVNRERGEVYPPFKKGPFY